MVSTIERFHYTCTHESAVIVTPLFLTMKNIVTFQVERPPLTDESVSFFNIKFIVPLSKFYRMINVNNLSENQMLVDYNYMCSI